MRFPTKSISLLAALVVLGPSTSALAQTCPQSSDGAIHYGDPGMELQTFAAAGTGGVVYSAANRLVELRTEAGSVTGEIFFSTGTALDNGCAADFDGDGWTDLVGINSGNNMVTFYKNNTALNQVSPPPDWNNAAYYTTPLFTPGTPFQPSGYSSQTGGSSMACGDFNGDTRQDFILVTGDSSDGDIREADMFRGNGNGTFQAPYQMHTDEDTFQDVHEDGRPAVVDINGDVWPSTTIPRFDFVFGMERNDKGRARTYLNNGLTGSGQPKFTTGITLKQDIPIGNTGATNVAYADFTRDGVRDLAVGGHTVRGVYLYHGISGGGFDAARIIVDAQWPSSVGPRAILARDYDLDGYTDLLAATNSKMFMWKNKATTFISGEADLDLNHQLATAGVGFDLDYDRDPAGTYDFILNGNNSPSAVAFANRVFNNYVDCAEIISDVVDLGIGGQQFIINSARLNPSEVINTDTTITWSMSIMEPPDWQVAPNCVSGDTTDYCVTFPQQTGQSLRWKAMLCSNPTHTATPQISQVEITADYTEAPEHYRAGVVINNGVAYVGGFEQPGDAGHFYAMPASLTSTYWDAADLLNNTTITPDSSRKVFTAAADNITQLPFTIAAAQDGVQGPLLQEALGVGNQTDLEAVIHWWRGTGPYSSQWRFGNPVDGLSKLGSVLTSTPAILSPPQRPYYYGEMQPSDKAKFDAFKNLYKNRPTVVMVGAKDGSIHGFRQDLALDANADGIADTGAIGPGGSGTEAWAYIPRRVAAGLFSDFLALSANNFPDGSPTLADVKIKSPPGCVNCVAEFRTIAIVGSGNGGKGFAAIDVTDTVTTAGVVNGPKPLWNYVPGGSIAGQTPSKAAVIRVKAGSPAVERFYAVMASGIASENPEAPWIKGLDVEAVDIATGLRAWRFRALCPITTDVVAFETDDELELGAPRIDGFVDRIVVADACGYVYKIDPQVDLIAQGEDEDDGWVPGLGPNKGDPNSGNSGSFNPRGQEIKIFFSVKADPLGVSDRQDASSPTERPIAGTIGLRPVTGGRIALFFGTGGIESFDPLLINVFYSIHADDATVRERLFGDPVEPCTGPGGTCNKFYGGVAVTPEQVLLTKAIDPPIVTTGVCDFGSAAIVGLDITDFSEDFTVGSTASLVSSLYGDQGAIYATSLSGEIIKVGDSGQDTATVAPPPQGQNGMAGSTTPVKRKSWREVLY